MDELPVEFLKRPVPLVALMGHTALHPSISKLFSPAGFRDEPDTPSLATLSFELDVTQLPKRKPRRTNYDNYSPAGIIKLSWLHKHMSILPAVVVLFFAFDEKKNPDADVLQQLEILKTQPRAASMKYLMVIVQKSGSNERVSLLRKRAEQILDTKLTFFLFNKDDLKGSVKRLEEQLKPLATLSYKEDIRRIKKDADKLPRQTHLLLLIRLKFKIAFLHETTQKFNSAHKYYNQAYSLLREMPRNSVQAVYEQKAVAEFFQLKITRLLLAHQLYDFPNDAITYFTRHVRNFRSVVGVPEREFEHWAWMCRQYQVFGELLERTYATSTTSGPLAFVPSLQSPAYYFEHAAVLALRRKKHVRKMAELLKSSPAFDKFTREKIEWIRSPYLGHPPSPALHPLDSGSSSDQPVVLDEMDANYRVVFSELLAKHDYSGQIISLFNRAFEYFKNSRYLRYANTVALYMAAEHLEGGNYDLARKCIERPTAFFRREQWHSLLASALVLSANLAMAQKATGEYVHHVVESLSLPGDQATRKQLMQRLEAALREPQSLSLPPLTAPVVIDMPTRLLLPSVSFEQPTVAVGGIAQIVVLIDSHLPAPLPFQLLRVSHKDIAEVAELKGELLLVPGKGSRFVLPFVPPKDATEVECVELRIESGLLTLRFPLTDLEIPLSSDAPYVKEKPHRRLLRVEQPRPNLSMTVKDNAPALVGELYRLSVTFAALGALPVTGTLECTVEMAAATSAAHDTTVLGEVLAGGLPLSSFPFQVAPGATTLVPLLFRATAPGERKLHFRAQFTDGVQSGLLTSTLCVSLMQPLEVTFEITPLHAHHTTEGPPPIVVSEQFFICAEARANTEHALEVLKAEIAPDSASALPASVLSSSFEDIITTPGAQPPALRADARLRLWFLMSPNFAGADLSLGQLALRWRHSGASDEATMLVPMPRIKIQRTPFSAVIDCPAHAQVGETITVTVTIHNYTSALQEFVLTVKEAEAFALSGMRVSAFRIPPGRDTRLRAALVPLTAGRHALPHFHLLSKRYDKELPQTKLKRFVYVQPT